MSDLYKRVQEKRPKLKLPYSRVEKFIEILAFMGLVVSVGLIIKYLPTLPDTIPTHFGFNGKADGWGSRNTLLMIPGITIALYLLLTALARVPQLFNYANKITEANARESYIIGRKTMIYIKTEVIFIFTYLEWNSIMGALNERSGLDLWFLPVTLIVVFGTVIYFIRKSVKLK